MITWTSKSWEDFVDICSHNPKMTKKVIKLVKDIERNGYSGIGKPEPLKGNLSGYWSRRIDAGNRIVYRIVKGNIQIV